MEQDYDGSGFINSTIDRFKAFFKGVRLDFPPVERALLQTYGNLEITQILVGRSPINDMLHKVLNLFSFGKWESIKRHYAFDKLFHLFMIVRFTNNKMVLVEKNEVIKITPSFNISDDCEFDNVPLKSNKLTLNHLFITTIKKVGNKRFFLYSAFGDNCQRFLMDILESNDLLTDKLKAFIYQDLTELVKQLPYVTKYLSQKVTDTAHQLNILMHGEGF